MTAKVTGSEAATFCDYESVQKPPLLSFVRPTRAIQLAVTVLESNLDCQLQE
jgi:hypothetical protein